MKLTCKEIVEYQMLNAEWYGASQPSAISISGVSTDSRTVKDGELFFAITGEKFDGHEFVQTVHEKNVCACVVAKDWYEKNAPVNGNCIVVNDVLVAYQEIARYYRKKFDIPVIAITGSAGKTTTKEMAFCALSEKYNVLRNERSFNNHIGVPATLFNLNDEHELLISEVGTNHFGELDRLSYLLEPNCCVFLNIGYAHLEFFKDLSGVAKAKLELLNHAAKGCTVIFNSDDEILLEKLAPLPSKKSFGLNNSSDTLAKVAKIDKMANYTFYVDSVEFKNNINGLHNVSNALAAIAIASHFDVKLTDIQKGLSKFLAYDKRMQIHQKNGVFILDDSYNANPSSCKAALKTLGDFNLPAGGRKIAVLADMLELGGFSEMEHKKLAVEAKNSGISALFLHGEHSKATAKEAKDMDFEHVSHHDSKDDMLTALANFIKKNDAVLIKGSRSMKMEEVVDKLEETV